MIEMGEMQETKALFGKNLVVLIRQRNWTIKKAAEEIGYFRNDLSAILSGNKNFQLRTAVKIAKYFDVSVFLMFDRLFDDADYRKNFPFVDADYMDMIRKNFSNSTTKQSNIDLDPTTVSHLIKGRRNNPTVNTLSKIAEGSGTTVSALLKTIQDKQIEKKLKEDSK